MCVESERGRDSGYFACLYYYYNMRYIEQENYAHKSAIEMGM